ncbi:ArnT family glycosyltransferase, partial [Streptomyces sp. NPDC004561]
SGTNRGHGSARSGAGRLGQAMGAAGAPGAQADPGRTELSGAGAWGGPAAQGRMTTDQRRLLDYTRAHQGSATYVFATTSWSTASPYILSTGVDVLPLGGFSGRAPFPTQDGFRRLVASGKVRYVLLGGDRGMGFAAGGSGRTATERITGWVRSSCTRVPASAYGGTDPSGAAASAPGRAGETASAQTLYRCGPGQ